MIDILSEPDRRCFRSGVVRWLSKITHEEKGIITNGNYDQQFKKLRNLGIIEHFTVMITSDEIGIAKPDKRIFIEASRRANRPTDACTYVGDRLHTDALSSKEAGMRGFWLNKNHEISTEEVEVIHSLSELSALLDHSL